MLQSLAWEGQTDLPRPDLSMHYGEESTMSCELRGLTMVKPGVHHDINGFMSPQKASTKLPIYKYTLRKEIKEKSVTFCLACLQNKW